MKNKNLYVRGRVCRRSTHQTSRMSDSRHEETFVRYYCTAGNGMEHFLVEEVKSKLAAENVCQIPGKVLFSSSAEIGRVCELKAAERLFLLLKLDTSVSPPTQTNKAKAASVLQSRLLGDKDQWISAAMTWRRLQRELERRRAAVSTPSTALGMTTKQEEGSRSEVEERCNVESRRRSGGQSRENGSGGPGGGEQSRAQTLEKKRKRDDEEEKTNAAQDCSSGKNEEKEGTHERAMGTGLDMEVSSCGTNRVISGADMHEKEHITPGLAHSVECNVRTTAGMAERDAARKMTDVKVSEGEKNPQQPSGIKPESPTDSVSFRISCKCTGSLSRYYSIQEVSRVIGVGLSRLLGWRIDLKNPELEVNVHLSDDHCLMGIPLIRLPLANRCYIKTTGLRSTVAWAMASLAQIKPGFCVVDPMCGVGTILIEAAQEHKAAHFLGMDIDDGQLQKASENIDFAELESRLNLLKASSTKLPLPSASVDAVVCDLPFGRKFGTKTDVAAKLPLILAEMERILRAGGTLVLLMSPQLSCVLKKMLAQRDTETSSNNQESELLNGAQDCSSLPKQQTFQVHQGIDSPPTQKTGCCYELQHSPPPPLLSLEYQATFRVSLGLIDGLIHKYVKKHI